MNIEIHQPELEALIQQRMASGAFEDVEEVLLHALKSSPLPLGPSAKPFGRKLVEDFAEAREILGGVALDFTRDPSAGRPVDLS